MTHQRSLPPAGSEPPGRHGRRAGAGTADDVTAPGQTSMKEHDGSSPGELSRLAAAAGGGDDDAGEELLARVHLIAHRYARARLGTYPAAAETAADVAQEVCMAVLSALPRYTDRGAPFEAFVYRVAANKVADAQRTYGRAAVVVGDDADGLLDGAVPSAETTVLRSEEAARAWALLEQLPPRMREVMVLRVAVGLSAEETAEALGSTAGAVRVTQHRALTRLRERWGEVSS